MKAYDFPGAGPLQTLISMSILFLLLSIAGCSAPEDDTKLNFIIIFDDQHNSKHMGWTGQGEGIRTPHIDQLASESVAFTNAYSSCPVCAPARHSVYTGLYPSQHGVIHNDLPLEEEIPTLMDLLAENGYTTANIGKMHFAPYNERHGFQYVLNHEFFADGAGISHFRPWLEREVENRGVEAERFPQWSKTDPQGDWLFSVNSLGFEHDIPLELTSEHWVSDNAIAFIEEQMEQRPDQPFFLHASYFAPHHPYGVVEEYNTYDPDNMHVPPSWTAGKADAFGKAQRERRNYPAFSEEDYKHLKATYFGFITQLDHEIGRLLDYIDSNPELASNTVVLFLSDHGDRMGEHGMLYKGGEGAMLEGSAGIPFMIRWPGQEPRIEKTPVTHIDILPTFLAASGGIPDPDLPGMDLKPLLESEDTESSWEERIVFSEWLSPLPFRYIMARKGKYKFIADFRQMVFPEMECILYDMEADPWELNNLALDPAYQIVVDELKEAVLKHYDRQKEYLPDEMPRVVPRSTWDISFPFKPWEKTEALQEL